MFLGGVIVGVKDIIDCKGILMICGVDWFFVIFVEYDVLIVKYFRDLGVNCFGKIVMILFVCFDLVEMRNLF